MSQEAPLIPRSREFRFLKNKQTNEIALTHFFHKKPLGDLPAVELPIL